MSASQQTVKNRSRFRFYVAAILATFSMCGAAFAQDVVIYDEALKNGFSTDYSYGDPDSGVVVGSTAQAHTGTHSISLTGNGSFNALSLTGSTTYDTGTYPVLHFWIYGSAPGGQSLQVEVRPNRDSDTNIKSAPLDGFISGGSVENGVWREVTINLTQSPLAYSGAVDRIDIQTEATQSAVYIDDVSLQQAVAADDEIFANGFEGGTVTPPPSNGIVDDQNITYDTITSDRFTWYDSANKQRIAVLAHNDAQSFAGSHGGELRDFVYQVGATARDIAAPARGDGGFGYIVSHPGNDCDGNGAAGDTSTLGHGLAGTWTRVFVGRHHAIFRFQQNYPRYCNASGTAVTNFIPVTVDWTFSTGRDNPLWSVTYDMSAIGANVLKDDSRAPYGTMNIDGSSGTYMDNDVGGFRWGDRYVFTANTGTLSSAWTWNVSNQIPFMELWTSGVDATMGVVQSQDMSRQDAGGGRIPPSDGAYDVSVYWNKTSAQGQACPNGARDQQTGQAHSLPCVGYWPYQANSFSYGSITETTNDAKMTWGTQYGFLGQSAYQLRDSTLPAGSTASGYPRKSYSVFVVFGQKSTMPVDAEIARSTALANTTLTASVGSVATTGPGGVNRTDTVTYSPAGYDPAYSALVFNASSNAVTGTISVGSGTLKNPMIIVRNYTSGAYPTTVKFGGATLTADADYFASLRSDKSELWITLNKTVTGASNTFQIIP